MTLISSSTTKEFKEMYDKISHKLKDAEGISEITKFHFPTTNLSKEVYLNQSTDPLLLTVREYYNHTSLYAKIPRKLLTRKLFKVIVMALGYSQGIESRRRSLIGQITEHYISEGLVAIPLTDNELTKLVNLISWFFTLIANQQLQTVQQFLKITQSYVESQPEKVTMKLEYLEWSLHIVKQKGSRHRVNVGPKMHHFQINYKFGVDKEQAGVTFPSIFVQGIDAHIVQTLIEKVSELNKELVKEGLPEIRLSVNHDNYGINVQYAHILIPLVREAYNSINKLSYKGMELPAGKNIKCINPNFIK